MLRQQISSSKRIVASRRLSCALDVNVTGRDLANDAFPEPVSASPLQGQQGRLSRFALSLNLKIIPPPKSCLKSVCCNQYFSFGQALQIEYGTK